MARQQSSASKNKRFYQPYLDAEWGLKNHWYPALSTHDLEEGNVKGFEIAGEPVMENAALSLTVATGATPKFVGIRTSMFLPGVLMVEKFPGLGRAQYEWYVPIDDKRHEYWQAIAGWCPSDEDRQIFENRYEHLYEPLALRDFNDHDLFAREAMQPFYENGGWEEEQLCSMDTVIVGWRKLVSRYNRGIQAAPR